ncbi:uncharacterized protein MONOS_17377 [Monocercomonoides exilis]|uniref:uncharacterized protein n=1 Tax=Monocercomonoides exilis TaxID=2049356 RepID=UPI00355A0A27|nr:hypothetical protein MONOS_17377 [Monocercomonoides exilis]
MNKINIKELESFYNDDVYYIIEEIMKGKKISLENFILISKRVGYLKALKRVHVSFTCDSWLRYQFKTMIIDEEKKEDMNGNLLVDFCECYALLFGIYETDEFLSICLRCLLKVSSNKEKNEETQKDVEMALLSLSELSNVKEARKELYLNQIVEIIKYHQEHRNLTQLAYQSTWKFLFYRIVHQQELKEYVEELHFVSEAARELEELDRGVDWKKDAKKEKEKPNVWTIKRWTLSIIEYYVSERCRGGEDNIHLIENIVKVYRSSKKNFKEITFEYFYLFYRIIENRSLKIEYLLEGGAFNLILEETMLLSTEREKTEACLKFFHLLSRRLDDESDETNETKGEEENYKENRIKQKVIKRNIFEKMEEEGYEDAIISYHTYEMKFIYFLPHEIDIYLHFN